MKAFNVNTRKCEELPDNHYCGGTHILIGSCQSVFDYCKELRSDYLKNHFSSGTAKVESIEWLKDGRVLVGFGTL